MSSVRTLTLGHSPDPDDAFMFYALAADKIPTGQWRFEHILQDIQTLNERATRGELHISAISIHAYAYVLDQYALLPCGASMGDNYGPMLIVRAGTEFPKDPAALRSWLRERKIAIPGMMTSAFLALGLYFGSRPEKFDIVPFDEIFAHIAGGKADVGLIIHEGQLTYAKEGFVKVLDLGEWWKSETGLPLPLGGNVIRKTSLRNSEARSTRSFTRAFVTASSIVPPGWPTPCHSPADWIPRWQINSSACTSTTSPLTTATAVAPPSANSSPEAMPLA
jgi:1,4-dihydroxy-6-naphthoate synthase